MPSRIYDTSALMRFSNDEKGSEKVNMLLQECMASGRKDKASVLTAFEFLFSMARKSRKPATGSLALLENILDFVPTDYETAQRAAFLRLKYVHLNLSLADAIILQTGIDSHLEIITCDRAWAQIKEAKVRVV